MIPRRRFLLFFIVLFGLQTVVSGQTPDSLAAADTLFVPTEIIDLPEPEKYTLENLSVDLPEIIVRDVETPLTFSYSGESEALRNGKFPVTVNGKQDSLVMESGLGVVKYVISDESQLEMAIGDIKYVEPVTAIPLWLSIIPPILAIIMALVFREVITALFSGIFIGAALIHIYIAGFLGIGKGLLAVLDTYILHSIADADHVSVIVFSMLIGAIVALISRNGGMKGVVDKVSKYAKNAKSGQVATWFLGIAIFFDDYANTLVVGNTMRPVTDRLRISREKLSYLVDSTAAPISAIAFITTWIGAELGYIQNGIDEIAKLGHTMPGDPSPYGIFISSLQYSFYPILTLAFMLMLILMNKDFGPMYKAELRARTTGQVSNPSTRTGIDREKSQELDDLEPVKGATANPWNAIIPIMVIIGMTVIGLWYTGIDSLNEGWDADPASKMAYDAQGFFGKLSDVVGSSNSYLALLWASLSGLFVAVVLTVSQRIMNLEQTIESVLGGFKTMMHAMIILIMAWSLAKVTEDMHTAEFLSQIMSNSVPVVLIPTLTFILAAAVSFSTGSSWGTMAILYPLLIPACWTVGLDNHWDPNEILPVLFNTVSCVLAGSVLGDHCSPISDTTILSSLASSCNHIDHVRTQLPYALTVGGVSLLIGTLPAAFGLPFYISVPLSLAVLYLIIRIFGKTIASS